MVDDRLRNLKRSIKRTVFSDLTFTEKHKEQIKSKITRMNVKTEEEIIVAVLHLLTQEKTGFELNKSIRARGIQNYENNEGNLYMFLHRLEQKGYLQSDWKENDEKYYSVTNKGTKLLSLADKKSTNAKTIFKEILEG
ncbi:MAG: PadR family transcriptional regulator [Bacillota bacterium]